MLRMMVGGGNPASSIHSSYCVLIPRNPNKTLKTQQLVFKINHTHHFHFHYKTSANSFTFCRLHARPKESTAASAVVSDFDDEYDDFDDDELDYDDEDEDEFMPFGKIKKWLETKPRGFGESKVYGTRIEDKLLEEIEQSRLAQVANINNLKYPNPAAPNKNHHQAKKTGSFASDISKSDDMNDSFDDPPLMVSVTEGEINADFKMDDSFFEETVSDIYKSDDLDEEQEDITENVEFVSKLDLSGYDNSEPWMEAATDTLSSKKQHKKRASKKKIIAKGGGKKVPKLDIPGSAKS